MTRKTKSRKSLATRSVRAGIESDTQHGSVVQFRGKWYVFYHTSELSNGNSFRRSVCVDELTFGEDGKINVVTPTHAGPAPLPAR